MISIIQATTFEKMIHVVTHELPELLDVDFITLAIEANADAPKRLPVRGVYVLAPGAIDAAIGLDKHARLRSSILGEDALFGEVSRFVKSDVLMQLQSLDRLARRRDVLRLAPARGLRPRHVDRGLVLPGQGAGEHHPRLARSPRVSPE